MSDGVQYIVLLPETNEGKISKSNGTMSIRKMTIEEILDRYQLTEKEIKKLKQVTNKKTK